jgi:hypothetical protein
MQVPEYEGKDSSSFWGLVAKKAGMTESTQGWGILFSHFATPSCFPSQF